MRPRPPRVRRIAACCILNTRSRICLPDWSGLRGRDVEVSIPDSPPTLPIRVSFRENGDVFFEAFKFTPVSSAGVFSEKNQRIFFVVLIVVVLAYVGYGQYREGQKIGVVLGSVCGVALMLVFWAWFFKKIGYPKST